MTLRSMLMTSLLITARTSLCLAQTVVGMGTETPNPNAVLELVPEDGNQGFLLPRLTTDQRTRSSFTAKLSDEDNGLLVYDTDLSYFFYWHGSQWHPVGSNAISTESDRPSLPPGYLLVGSDQNQAVPVPLSQDVNLTAGGAATTVGIRGVPVHDTAPQEGQILKYREGQWKPTSTSANQWYSGPENPTSDLPRGANDGDLYFNTSTQEMFLREADSWTSVGKLVDPKQQAEVYSGTLLGNASPDPQQGKIGDIFVETDPDYDVYIKVAEDRWKKIDDRD